MSKSEHGIHRAILTSHIGLMVKTLVLDINAVWISDLFMTPILANILEKIVEKQDIQRKHLIGMSRVVQVAEDKVDWSGIYLRVCIQTSSLMHT